MKVKKMKILNLHQKIMEIESDVEESPDSENIQKDKEE